MVSFQTQCTRDYATQPVGHPSCIDAQNPQAWDQLLLWFNPPLNLPVITKHLSHLLSPLLGTPASCESVETSLAKASDDVDVT